MLLYCVLIKILTYHASSKETNLFHFKSHHIITVSRQWWCFLPLAANDRPTDWDRCCLPSTGAGTKEHRLRQMCCSYFSVCKFSILFKLMSKTPHSTTLLFFGPVTRLRWLKCSLVPPMALHHRHSLDNRFFNQRNHSFKVQCQAKRIKSTWWSGWSLWSGPRLQKTSKNGDMRHVLAVSKI